MKEIIYDFNCDQCGFTWLENYKDGAERCPVCGSSQIFSNPIIICDCGARISVRNFTNICPECGAFYNSFGQKLVPPEEWDTEDFYGTFCPEFDSDLI